VILVTVGTQFFDELIEEVDQLVETGLIRDEVRAQIGLAQYHPRHLSTFAFDRNILDIARRADLIISHAGTGLVMELISLGRPFIAVANQTKAENHQVEFLHHLSTTYDFCWIASPGELAGALPRARPATRIGTSGVESLAEDLRSFLHSVCRV
jgi:UDP-N-acetylglucosamine transferase subunit ALG13